VKLSAVRTNEGRLFQTVGAQHENRRAAVFVDEDCRVDSSSDVFSINVTSLDRRLSSLVSAMRENRIAWNCLYYSILTMTLFCR